MEIEFDWVDVFAEERFGGNQLAVFVDAAGIDDASMQAIASEMNLSETTFVLPPADHRNDARVRIFNRTTEMAFAGHPSVGTACVLARRRGVAGRPLRLEMPAGLVVVDLDLDPDGKPVGASVAAPQALTLGERVPAAVVAGCLGLAPDEVMVTAHEPVVASVGNPYVIAEVGPAALSRCEPDRAAFRAASEARPHLAGRFSVFVYARGGEHLRARMFAPLAGTWEDPATGSANAPLAGLLLSLDGGDAIERSVRQGVDMGRPSLLRIGARRDRDGIRTWVAGSCIPVMTGKLVMEVAK